MLMERKGHVAYNMCLRIYLRVCDVLLGGISVELGPSFIEQVVIVLLVNSDARASIRTEEQSLASLGVDEEMFEVSVGMVRPWTLQEILSQ